MDGKPTFVGHVDVNHSKLEWKDEVELFQGNVNVFMEEKMLDRPR
jgi:hypothetical protein